MVQVSGLKAIEGEAEWEAKIEELMEAVDSNIPEPERVLDKPFAMPVEDVFSIQGRGTVVTGRIEQGKITAGEEVEIMGIKKESMKTTCTGVEMFKKSLDFGQAGDNVGLLMRGLKRVLCCLLRQRSKAREISMTAKMAVRAGKYYKKLH